MRGGVVNGLGGGGATFPGKNGRIAYSAFVDGSRGDAIYTIDASGGGRTRVTNTDNAFVQGPSWGSRP
jgi:hypothetical protein